MQKLKSKKFLVKMILILLFVSVCLIYTRPLNTQQRYPMLSLDKCTGISGYYYNGAGVDFEEFSCEKNSQVFEEFSSLLYKQEYRRSLRDLFPRNGARAYQPKQGEFQWEVFFHFEDVVLPDGSVCSGEMLRIQSWYGELDIHFNGDTFSCYTNNQKLWAKEVLDFIMTV